MRVTAAGSLGQQLDQRATGPLLAALRSDPSPKVRYMAAAAFNPLGDQRAIPATERAQREDPDAEVRAAGRSLDFVRRYRG